MTNQDNYEEMQTVANNIKVEELYYFLSASWTVLFENILFPMGKKVKSDVKEVPWSKRWQPNSLWYVIIVDYTVYLVLRNRIQGWNKFTNLTLCNKYICKDIKIKDSYTNATCN